MPDRSASARSTAPTRRWADGLVGWWWAGAGSRLARAHRDQLRALAAKHGITDLRFASPGRLVGRVADDKDLLDPVAFDHAAEELLGATKIGAWLARALDVTTDERSWRVGAAGEETVGARLEKLTEHGWHVLHSVPVGQRGSDIDHVLVGPGGVFTVNVKNHLDGRVWVGAQTVRVNGHRVPYLRNARFEAARAAQLLSGALQDREARAPRPSRSSRVRQVGSRGTGQSHVASTRCRAFGLGKAA